MGEGTEKIRLPTPVLTGSGSRVCCALSAPRWRSPVVWGSLSVPLWCGWEPRFDC